MASATPRLSTPQTVICRQASNTGSIRPDSQPITSTCPAQKNAPASTKPSPSATPETDQQAAVTADDSSSNDSSGGGLGDVFDAASLRSAFTRGLVIAGAVFLAVGAFFGVRRLLMWLWYLIAP